MKYLEEQIDNLHEGFFGKKKNKKDTKKEEISMQDYIKDYKKALPQIKKAISSFKYNKYIHYNLDDEFVDELDNGVSSVKVADISLTDGDYVVSDSEYNIITKAIVKLVSDINSNIDSKYCKVDDDWDKYEGSLFLSNYETNYKII